jgi:hypothetical protein
VQQGVATATAAEEAAHSCDGAREVGGRDGEARGVLRAVTHDRPRRVGRHATVRCGARGEQVCLPVELEMHERVIAGFALPVATASKRSLRSGRGQS